MKNLHTIMLENKTTKFLDILKNNHILSTSDFIQLKYSDLFKIGIRNLGERAQLYKIITDTKRDYKYDQHDKIGCIASYRKDEMVGNVLVPKSVENKIYNPKRITEPKVDFEKTLINPSDTLNNTSNKTQSLCLQVCVDKQTNIANKLNYESDLVALQKTNPNDCPELLITHSFNNLIVLDDSTNCRQCVTSINLNPTKSSNNIVLRSENQNNESLNKMHSFFGDYLKPKDAKQSELEIKVKHASETLYEEKHSPIKMQSKITVCIRKKPVINDEIDVTKCEKKMITVREVKKKLDTTLYAQDNTFTFDYIFDENAKNTDIFEAIKSVTHHALNGGNGSIIAYGQTGTGKTHTMFHPSSGLVFLSIQEWLKYRKNGYLSFYEIYNGHAYDLLEYKEEIDMREKDGNVYLQKLSNKFFSTYEEGVQIIKEGMIMRRTGATAANQESSRSHAILRIGGKESNHSCDSNNLIFVDLAGSERGSDRKDVNNIVRHEGAEINKSLLALKECIRGMDKASAHLPFRQSKLTQILKNSLVGNSKTCIIAAINPTVHCIEHTMNTIRYANRIKELKNKNESICDAKYNDSNNSVIKNVSIPNMSSAYINLKKNKVTQDISDSNPEVDNKNVFDSTFKTEATSEALANGTFSAQNAIEKINITVEKQKIEKETRKIVANIKNSQNLKMLKNISSMLKNVQNRIDDFKF